MGGGFYVKCDEDVRKFAFDMLSKLLYRYAIVV